MSGQLDTEAYNGEESFVVAIDLGTTHSAVSFAHMSPGDKTNVRMVTEWPGHMDARGVAKIPSIIAYQHGEAEKFGAEATECLDDPAYEVAKWFKLHLHPNAMQNSNSEGLEIPDLPYRTSLSTIYSDFLRYLFQSTQAFFEGSTPNGANIWQRLRDKMIIVLAIPNGWDTTQQGFLRNAAIKGGLVTEDNADLLLEFVTEGEASVHYALNYTPTHTWLKPGTIFAVTDAGGSTVDSTLYKCKAIRPKLVLEEVRASECVQAGGVFVDRAAQKFLKHKLRNSERFSADAVINDMIVPFEGKTKRLFNGTQTSNIITFGGRTDTDRSLQIFQGKITLSKEEITGIFDGVIKSIIESCKTLMQGHNVKHLLLVGGFGDSPHLRRILREEFSPQDIEVVNLEEASRKAAAEGAGIWYTKQLVATRAARFHIGTPCSSIYNPMNFEHMRRQSQKYVGEDGRTWMKGCFHTFVEKNFLMDQDFKVEKPFVSHFSEKPTDLGNSMTIIMAWDANGPTKWMNDASGNLLDQMRPLCILSADLSRLAPSLSPKSGVNGKTYWEVDFKVVIRFGGTKLRACMQWEEGGRTCEGPVSIVSGSIE